MVAVKDGNVVLAGPAVVLTLVAVEGSNTEDNEGNSNNNNSTHLWCDTM